MISCIRFIAKGKMVKAKETDSAEETDEDKNHWWDKHRTLATFFILCTTLFTGGCFKYKTCILFLANIWFTSYIYLYIYVFNISIFNKAPNLFAKNCLCFKN